MQNISDARRSRLVDLLAGRLREPMAGAVQTEQDRDEVLEIRTEADITNQIARWTKSLRDLNLKETPEEAEERERKLISYYGNMEAQDRASGAHAKTLAVLANYLLARGVKPKASVIDLFAERGEVAFIFEVKSIHTENFRHQTRMAIGQLIDYEYFQVRRSDQGRTMKVEKCLVYSKKPPLEIAEFLLKSGFQVFWTRDGDLEGAAESLKALSEFTSA